MEAIPAFRPPASTKPGGAEGGSLFVACLCLLTGVLLTVEISVLGRLFAGELILAVAACVGVAANIRNARFWRRDFKLLLFLLLISILSYVAADVIRNTASRNALRGWARVAFTFVDMIGFYVLSRKNRSALVLLVMGMAAGELMVFKEQQLLVEWKYYLGMPAVAACLGMVYLCCRKGRVFWSVAVLCIFGYLNMILDSRAGGGVCFFCATVLIGRSLPQNVRWRRLVPLLRVSAAVVLVVVVWWTVTGTNRKFQARRDLSFAFRSASVLTAMDTIKQHPLLGIGSWASTFEGRRVHREIVTRFGVRQDTEPDNQAGHSAILQSWVEAGFPGAAVFLYYLFLLGRSMFRIGSPGPPLSDRESKAIDRLAPFALYELCFATWHCLFSPFLGPMRVEVGLAMAICLAVSNQAAKRVQFVQLAPVGGPAFPELQPKVTQHSCR